MSGAAIPVAVCPRFFDLTRRSASPRSHPGFFTAPYGGAMSPEPAGPLRGRRASCTLSVHIVDLILVPAGYSSSLSPSAAAASGRRPRGSARPGSNRHKSSSDLGEWRARQAGPTASCGQPQRPPGPRRDDVPRLAARSPTSARRGSPRPHRRRRHHPSRCSSPGPYRKDAV